MHDIEIIRSKRKTIGLQVRPDSRVILRVPRQMKKREIEQFIDEYREWIDHKLSLMEERNARSVSTGAPAREKISAKEWQQIRNTFIARVQYFCSRMQVKVGRVTIRNQKTRWGSCSAKGNVNFNYQLYYMPRELMDYVIIHELAHRQHMDHSAAFWQEVEQYCPDYKECRQRLKKYTVE